MLFIRDNSLSQQLSEGERLRLLDALRARGLTPLLRSARRRRFGLLAAGHGDAESIRAGAEELERLCAAQAVAAGDAYTPGELFCAADCVLFLLFADERVSAGIIYNVATREPLAQLERFCGEVREVMDELAEEARASASAALLAAPRWQSPSAPQSQGLARFIAAQPNDFAVAAKCRARARALAETSELLENDSVRLFLRRVQEMRREGYSPRRLFAEAETLGGVSVEELLGVGLLEREVTVRCRQSGHALFDLPSPDSLAAITISKAKCSQCSAPVVDEIVEETFNPSRFAATLLEEGGWLSARVYNIIRSLGVPDSEIATGPPSAQGESCLAVDVCGHSFLFVNRDGDLSPAFSRRVAEMTAETETTHLVVVVTGAVEDEGRLRLYQFAWRRSCDGRDLNVTLVEGLGGAAAAIERAFASALRRELSRRLFPLDAALGFSASNFVLDWFRLAGESRAASRSEAALAPPLHTFERRAAS